MWRKLFYLFFAVTISWTVMPLSLAVAQTVFGPIALKTSKWHIHLSDHTFHVDDPEDGVIIVSKIKPHKRIWGGVLLLNRRPIPLPHMQGRDEIIIPIKRLLKTRNHLKVFLAGSPGASVRIVIKQTGGPLPPPQVSFATDPGSVHTGESSTLKWSTTNADSVSIDQGIGRVNPNGLIAVSPSQTTTYTLTAGNSGGTARAKVTVTFLNTDPVATDDAIITDENTPVTTTSVLANDTDTDGDALTVSGFTQTANGTVVSLGDGAFTYTPDVGFSGADSFSYTVGDGHDGSDTASVAVQVVPATLSLEIVSPRQGQAFTTDTISVAGTINRADSPVFVNGIAAVVSGKGFTAEPIPLLPGVNTISALAEDGTDTAVASITVFLDMSVDLEPIHVDITSISENDGSLNIAGQATVTIANNGGSNVSLPYHIVLFEDTNLSGGYEEAEDNRLGEETVAAGPGAGQSTNLTIDFSGQLMFRGNRLHVHVDSAAEVQESNEDNNSIAAQAGGTDLSASLLMVDDTACPDEIGLTVRIGNAGDASVPAGVPVAFYDGEPGNGRVPIGTMTTPQPLEPGQYEDLTLHWPNPPAGLRLVYAQADDDGTGTGVLPETDEENNRIFSTLTICAAPVAQANGISGQVIDAVTGGFLSGATVYLYQEENGASGALVSQMATDDYGGYLFSDLDPGEYFLVAQLVGYIASERPVTLTMDEALAHQDLVLSPTLDSGELRIVLTWGEAPADLEAHLTAPNPDGCRHHLFYWDKSIPGASLDVDTRQSYGPETISISQLQTGTYRFYVHDFTNRLSGSSTALSTSGATVTVYSGDGGTPMVFNVPAGAGTVWHVFNLDGTSGDVTPIDKMTHQDQPGQIDFPRITSSPVASATYKETYVYQIEAEDPDQDTLTYNLIKGPAGMQLDPFSGLIQWTPAAGQGQWQDVEVRVNDGRCGEDTQTFRIFLTYLPVVQFEVTPCSGMNPGGEITFTWLTERADTVTIDQGIGEVATSGNLSIPSPDQPTAYTLTATNGAGQTQRTVPKPPLISSLSASCISSPGETATLTWGAIGAVICHFDQGIGSVPASGSVTVAPAQLPQIYSLTCTNAGGGAFKKMNLPRCRPTAQLTENTDCSWSLGNPVTLEWSTTDVNECSVDPEVGSVPLNGSLEVWPSELPARYQLSCNGASDYVFIKNSQTVELSASSDALLPGQSTSLFWKTTCVDTCSFDQGIGDVATGGNVTVTPSQLPITYTLTATSVNGTSLTKSVTIRMLKPTAIFSASPAMLKPGEPAILSWTTERATSCNIQPDIGDVPLNGSITVSPDQNTTYTLTAIGPGGSTKGIAAVNYIKPTVTIYADPATLDTVGQTTTLTWVFSNADTCVIDQGIGEVQLGGSIVVSPIRTTIYKITATGPGGVATSSVTVAYPYPIVTFSADRETLDEGETATLTWSSSNVDTCTIDQGVGDVSPAGSVVVDPAQTTTYTITASGPGGTIKNKVTLTCLAPTASIQADPATIIEGQTTTLSWQTEHAATMVMEPLPGQVATEGNITVTPAVTTTYTFTASGRGGTASAETTVTVINPPSIDLIEPDGIEDNTNASFTVRWTDRDPDSDAVIALYYDINNSGADGTLIVGGLAENADGLDDQYVWNTSDIPAGDYYVYALIDDGVNTPVVDYSAGPVTIDHAVGDETKLTAGDGAAHDSFGSAVSIDGDYAVVGAPDHDSSGAAYIYQHEGSVWSEQIKLTAGGGASSGHFGKAVSISGDTVVVGAPDENESRGAVYVFTNAGPTWTQQARLTATDGQASENFGVCVAVSDVTMVVGAPDHNGGAGAAYVFTREGSSWGSPVKLTAGNGDGDGRFGASVSIRW